MKYKRSGLAAIFILSLFLSIAACRTIKYPEEYNYSVPKDLHDGLVPVSLAESGADMNAITDEFEDYIFSGMCGEVHSILGAKGNRIFLEEYYPGKAFHGGYTEFNAETRHSMASVTKSICSILVGIAIDRGFIESVDEPMLNYYPEYENTDPLKEKVTIRHLLTMTAGFDWDEHSYPYTSLKNDIVRFYISPDPVMFVLKRKIVTEPGKEFLYNGGGVNILGDIIKRASGMAVDEFAGRYLFSPLGIETPKWVHLAKDTVYTSGDIKLTPRDLLKIGLLFLNRGVWNAERLVSEKWIADSTAQSRDFDTENGYGYLWWTGRYQLEKDVWIPHYSARGWGDQYLFVIPECGLIFVSTGGNYSNGSGILQLLGPLAGAACGLDFSE